VSYFCFVLDTRLLCAHNPTNNPPHHAGIGNWVADEVLYQARLHPEQYSNTFAPEQVQRLHDSIVSICTTACETLADSAQFPETWLMKYRWDKGKKGADANVLPNGEKIVHLKVGGRTSAIVPSVQKKTAAVAGDVDGGEEEEEGAGSKTAKGRKRKVKAEDESEGEKPAPKKAAAKGRGKANGKAAKVKEQQDSDEDVGEGAEESSDVKEEEEEAKPKKKTAAAKKEKVEKPAPAAGTRRSARTKAM
jgi:formamidopyrimidine-DNA glycosylase